VNGSNVPAGMFGNSRICYVLGYSLTRVVILRQLSVVSRSPPHVVAAILFALCASLPGGIWVILLFVGTPQTESVAHQFHGLIAKDNPARWFFIFLAALFFGSALLSGAYFSPIARGRRWALTLLVLSCVQAVTAGFVIAWPMGLFFTAPLYWAIQNWRRAC
jgi:hypothetical protein